MTLTPLPASVDYLDEVRFAVRYVDADNDAPRVASGALGNPTITFGTTTRATYAPYGGAGDFKKGVEYYFVKRDLDAGRAYAPRFTVYYEDAAADGTAVDIAITVQASPVFVTEYSLMFQDFTDAEAGGLPPGFSVTDGDRNYWHVTDTLSGDHAPRVAQGMRGKAAWFAQPTRGTYDDPEGGVARGSLESPIFDLEDVSEPVLSFSSYFETTGRARQYVEISTNPHSQSPQWQVLRELDGWGDGLGAWRSVGVDLRGYGDQEVQFRFTFDAVDNQRSQSMGWLIDDVTIGHDEDGDSLPDVLEESAYLGAFGDPWLPLETVNGQITTYQVRGNPRLEGPAHRLYGLIYHPEVSDLEIMLKVERAPLPDQNAGTPQDPQVESFPVVIWNGEEATSYCQPGDVAGLVAQPPAPVVKMPGGDGLRIDVNPATCTAFPPEVFERDHVLTIAMREGGTAAVGRVEIIQMADVRQTSKFLADTDGDSVPDGQERNQLTDPAGPDSDHDGIADDRDPEPWQPNWIPGISIGPAEGDVWATLNEDGSLDSMIQIWIEDPHPWLRVEDVYVEDPVDGRQEVDRPPGSLIGYQGFRYHDHNVEQCPDPFEAPFQDCTFEWHLVFATPRDRFHIQVTVERGSEIHMGAATVITTRDVAGEEWVSEFDIVQHTGSTEAGDVILMHALEYLTGQAIGSAVDRGMDKGRGQFPGGAGKANLWLLIAETGVAIMQTAADLDNLVTVDLLTNSDLRCKDQGPDCRIQFFLPPEVVDDAVARRGVASEAEARQIVQDGDRFVMKGRGPTTRWVTPLEDAYGFFDEFDGVVIDLWKVPRARYGTAGQVVPLGYVLELEEWGAVAAGTGPHKMHSTFCASYCRDIRQGEPTAGADTPVATFTSTLNGASREPETRFLFAPKEYVEVLRAGYHAFDTEGLEINTGATDVTVSFLVSEHLSLLGQQNLLQSRVTTYWDNAEQDNVPGRDCVSEWAEVRRCLSVQPDTADPGWSADLGGNQVTTPLRIKWYSPMDEPGTVPYFTDRLAGLGRTHEAWDGPLASGVAPSDGYIAQISVLYMNQGVPIEISGDVVVGYDWMDLRGASATAALGDYTP